MRDAESLKESRHRFALAARFNTAPAADLHPDYIPKVVDQNLFRRLAQSSRGSRVLSQWISAEHKLTDDGFWLFDEPRRRLALISRETLDQLMRYIGAAMHYRELTALIDRDQVREIRSTIGEGAYRFATRRASLMIGSLNEEIAKTQSWKDTGPWPERILAAGADCLSICLAGEPPVLVKRLRLKLPKGMKLENVALVPEPIQARLWNVMRRILEVEIDRELTKCFS